MSDERNIPKFKPVNFGQWVGTTNDKQQSDPPETVIFGLFVFRTFTNARRYLQIAVREDMAAGSGYVLHTEELRQLYKLIGDILQRQES